MTLTLSNPGNPHPAIVQVFQGWGTPFHIALGFLSGMLNTPLSAAALAAFTGYQVAQIQTGQTFQATGGDILEFAIGLALAGLIKR